MKISVELSHVCSLSDIPDHAAAIEENGFHRVWAPDTLVSPWDAWLAADLVAHYTSRVNIGLGVTNPFTRHPMVTAQMAATLQAVSDGRLALSVGKGIGRLLEKAGISTHPRAVEECIHILRGLISGKRVTFQGEFFRIDHIQLRTIPPEKAVPIYMAAVGPESWKKAVNTADGIETIWSDQTAGIKQRTMKESPLPTAALVPFSLAEEAFFPNTLGSFKELAYAADRMNRSRFDEMIIAYRDLGDLACAREIIDTYG
ncbi:MAG: LLM class flavin-dependent oxidoreductase [Desulfobacterales bacterium]